MKGLFLLGTLIWAMIGYAILLCDVSQASKIVAASIVTSGMYPSIILLNAWIVINAGGFTKRATTWALAEIIGNSFSIMGGYIYTGPPRFHRGFSVSLGMTISAIVLTALLMLWMSRLNKKKEAELREYASEGKTHPHTGKGLEEVQDFHVEFRYIL